MAWPDLTDFRTHARDLLNESTAGKFTDAILNRWANDGERDVAIKTLCYENITQITTAVDTRMTTVPAADYYQINKVLHVEENSGLLGLIKINPLMLGHLDLNGNSPQFWFPWGKAVGIEPLDPTNTYTLNVYASCIPVLEMSGSTDEPTIPVAGHQLILQYMYYRGLIRARMFAKAAKIYSDYIVSAQALRDDVIEKYKNIVAEVKIPDKVVAVRGGAS